MENLRCVFGSGKQLMSECTMIYVHWPGYYPGEENYLKALVTLCPNMTPELKKHIEEKIIDIKKGRLCAKLRRTKGGKKNAGR